MSNITSQFVDQVDDTKIQITANGLSKSLKQAISDEDIGKPGGGLGLLYAQSFKSLALNTFITGNDVNLSAGIIAGSFAEETTSPLSGARSLKYTQALGSLNDFILSEALPVSPKFRGRRLVSSGNYTYKNGNNFDIQFIFYDVTNSKVTTVRSDAFKSSDGIKIARFYTTIPDGCLEYRWGFKVNNETVGAELVFDDIELDTDPIKILSLPVEDDIGRIEAYGRNNVPSGWLYCDGSAVSRTTYDTLFAHTGTSFGAGDGSTTFNLPDLRGEFLRGEDDGRGVDTGRTLGSWQGDELRSHNHAIWGDGRYNLDGAGRLPAVQQQYLEAWSWTELTGGNETRPRNVAVRYYIKAESLQRLYSVTNEGRGIVGEVIAHASEDAPANFLYCNGAAISRTVYSELYAVVGTKFGIGDGSTTFNTPDLRGQFIRGQDDGRGLDPDAGARAAVNGSGAGDAIGSSQSDAFRSHRHAISTSDTDTLGIGNSPVTSGGNNGMVSFYNYNSNYYYQADNMDGDSVYRAKPVGGSETRPSNLNLRYYIRHQQDPINVFTEVFDDYREVLSTTGQDATAPDTYTEHPEMTIDIDPGVWFVGYETGLYLINDSGSFQNCYGNIALKDMDNSLILPDSISLVAVNLQTGNLQVTPVNRHIRISVTQATQIRLVVRGNIANGTDLRFISMGPGFTAGLTDPDNTAKIWARKVKDV